MNAPEMVLQRKSWRNREQPSEINSRYATFVRRNWPRKGMQWTRVFAFL